MPSGRARTPYPQMPITIASEGSIDHNDLIRMEGELYTIDAFGGVGDMTDKPIFLQLHIQRRFANPNGALVP